MPKDGKQCGARRMAGNNDDNAGSSSGLGMLEALGVGIGIAALAGFGIAALLQRSNTEEPSHYEYVHVQEQYRPMVSETLLNRDIGEEECSICKELLCSMCGGQQQNIVQLICSHIFHENCFQNWLQLGQQTNCPICRGENVRGEIVNEKCKEVRSEKE